MNPTISIVMPAYNSGRYIVTTVKSVQAQTFTDFELIVIDDGSTDDTVALVNGLAETDPRIRVVRMEKNFGRPAGPRNLGVRKARGEWVAFLDSDDIWHPRKLELQMAALAETGTQFCSAQMIDFEDETALRLPDNDKPRIEKVSFLRQLIKSRTATSAVLVKRDLVLRHPFNEDAGLKAREDMECWLRCFEEIGYSIKLMTPLVGYRVIPGQISGNKWLMVKRHHYMLKSYRRRSGRGLGWTVPLFTASHFLLAVVYRRINRGL